MKSSNSLTRLGIIVLFLSNLSVAQNVEVDISACDMMYNALTAMRNGAPRAEVSSMLDSIIVSKPYQTMFKHYNRSFRPNHLPPPVFKSMILSLGFAGEYEKGQNQRADQMFPIWKKFYDDMPLFEKNVRQLRQIDLSNFINEGVRYAQTWLPPEWRIPDSYFFIHPNGGSDAFAIEKSQGYDFFCLPRDSSDDIRPDELIATVSHESHHLGIKGSFPGVMTSSDSVAYEFLLLFVGEGTATKFVDNAPGGCVPVINESRSHVFKGELDKLWKVYTSEEATMFERMTSTFEKAYSGGFTRADLNAEIQNYWLTGLKGPAYFLGSELFGAIYHAFGKEHAFTAMQDPRRIFQLYNDAIKRKPELLAACYKIPGLAVQHALAIGLSKK